MDRARSPVCFGESYTEMHWTAIAIMSASCFICSKTLCMQWLYQGLGQHTVACPSAILLSCIEAMTTDGGPEQRSYGKRTKQSPQQYDPPSSKNISTERSGRGKQTSKKLVLRWLSRLHFSGASVHLVHHCCAMASYAPIQEEQLAVNLQLLRSVKEKTASFSMFQHARRGWWKRPSANGGLISKSQNQNLADLVLQRLPTCISHKFGHNSQLKTPVTTVTKFPPSWVTSSISSPGEWDLGRDECLRSRCGGGRQLVGGARESADAFEGGLWQGG